MADYGATDELEHSPRQILEALSVHLKHDGENVSFDFGEAFTPASLRGFIAEFGEKITVERFVRTLAEREKANIRRSQRELLDRIELATAAASQQQPGTRPAA